jgi:branched-chain amino acid transport system substrate-binding protein
VLCALLLPGLLFSARAGDGIRIAMITARTGEAGRSNAVSFDGARFAVECINESGGILGQKVELLEFDNRGTPEGSAVAGRRAIEAGVTAVVGCNWSSHSLAMAEVLQKAGVPMISHMSTNEAVTRVGDCIFRICFTDSFQGSGLARFALEKLDAATAVVLVDVSRAYCRGLAQSFADAFERGGGKVVWRGEYEARTLDVDAVLGEVARHQADVLFAPGGYTDVSVLFGSMGDHDIKTVLMTGDGVGRRMYEYIGAKAEGIYFSGHWSRWSDTPQSRDFVSRYEALVGTAPSDTGALVHDSFMVLRDAIERAGTTVHSHVRDALATTAGFEGVTGTIRFNEFGDPIKPLVINQFRFGGVMFVGSIQP